MVILLHVSAPIGHLQGGCLQRNTFTTNVNTMYCEVKIQCLSVKNIVKDVQNVIIITFYTSLAMLIIGILRFLIRLRLAEDKRPFILRQLLHCDVC
jgi:hypothetical protein